ncbi:MAG: DUF5009 domain-containing protein [Cyclobacteriaceae bacterium]|nr:DUF5009 domain-containing protein [Cyclobacteriaceae bacterium]
MSAIKIPSRRLDSIDVMRALTMFLMIFVNDLWTLHDIPGWLDHVGAQDDGMGLADVVFPMFLFIVGLSIPMAIENRLKKGGTTGGVLMHIGTRTLALLIMGLFHVNMEHYYPEAALLSKPVFTIITTAGFFMIWLDYRREWNPVYRKALTLGGIALLAFMASLYKGEEGAEVRWMQTYWWGILGLIGWAYLTSSLVYVLFRNNFTAISTAFVFFILFNTGWHSGWLHSLEGIRNWFWFSQDGAMAALTMCGVFTTLLFQKILQSQRNSKLLLVVLFITIALLILGFWLRPLGGISKIRATPSWILICSAINVFFFGLLYYICDIKKKAHWFSWLKPAGTSTLTCYLLPYFHYSIFAMVGWSFPLALRTGIPGLAKSLLYSFVIIQITGLLEKISVRLRI